METRCLLFRNICNLLYEKGLGGITMKNGIYKEIIELRIKVMSLDDDLLAIITNMSHPDEPMILTGENAEDFVEEMAKRMNPAFDES